MVEKNIRLKTHLGNGVYNTLHPETNSKIVRVGDKNLDETLGDVTAQLAHKADELDVYLKSNGININDFDEPTRKAILELNGIDVNYILGEGNVKPENISFITSGKNIFDKSKVTVGSSVNANNGNLVIGVDFSASDFIGIKTNTSYIITGGAYSRAFYDTNKVYISGQSGAGLADTFLTPSNAKYVRTSIFTASTSLDTYMIEEGTVKTAYEPFRLVLDKVSLENGIFTTQFKDNFKVLEGDTFKDKFYESGIDFKPSQIEGFTIGKNLFNKAKATAGGYVSDSNGTIVTNADFFYSEYIPVIAGESYIKKGTYRFAFYTIDKLFISGGNRIKSLTAPSNAAFVRISTYKEDIGSPVTPGIDGEQLELGTVSTPFEPWGFLIANLTIPTEESERESLSINLPSKIYGIVGEELNIYFDNLLSEKDSRFDYDITCTIGGQYENYFRVTPTTAGSFPFSLAIYRNDKEVLTASSTIIIKATNVGNAVTKKLFIIGDSTTDNDFIVPKIKDNFSTDVMNIETIGTKGSVGSKHEGRAGWTTDMFMGRNVSYASPFIFNGVFDYSQYILSNSLDTPDYVTINLGINDFFAVTNDSIMQTRMNATVTDYNTMIASIKTQNPDVKILIALTIPPNYSQDAFGVNYASGQTRKRYKRNNFLWVKKLMETFANREGENIYLLPIHLNLDTRHNFGTEQKKINARNPKLVDYPIPVAGVHPVESGYWQIADSYWYFLKSFEI